MDKFKIEDTKKLAQKVAQKLSPGDAVALSGDLGSGKTTFVRFLVEALGFDSKVQSPTFVICRKYIRPEGPIKTINHIDLYRLQTKKEIRDLGLPELLSEKDAVCVVEWPEMIVDLFPKGTLKINFEYENENERRIGVRGLY